MLTTNNSTLEKIRRLTKQFDTTVESNEIDAEDAKKKVAVTLQIVKNEMQAVMKNLNGHLDISTNRKLREILELVSEVRQVCQPTRKK